MIFSSSGGKMKPRLQNIKRRELLQMLAGASILPLFPLSACAEKKGLEAGFESPGETTDSSDEHSIDDTGDLLESGIDERTGWAIGGTANMPDKASYPDPFTMTAGECLLLAPTTLGPCIVDEEFDREDISEGWNGVPLRLGLRIMDESCTPISGAKIKIWHTGYSGSYSGDTPRNDICLLKPEFASQHFFRGHQITDSAGIVFFDTCFPGWYPGRVIHIHIEIIINNTSTYASQLFFPEDVVQEICGHHSIYQPFGVPNVQFQTDGVLDDISIETIERHILEIEKMTDGAMLASKSITIMT